MRDIVERLDEISDPRVRDHVRDTAATIISLRKALADAIPGLELAYAMTRGGPKKSDALAVLKRARALSQE